MEMWRDREGKMELGRNTEIRMKMEIASSGYQQQQQQYPGY